MVDPDTLVPLGFVAGAHGLQGELRVRLFNAQSRALLAVTEVVLRGGAASGPSERRVRSVRAVDGGVLLALEGAFTRESAEELRGTEVCVKRASLPSTAPGEYYHVDLVGLAVRTADGRAVGSVVDVLDYPSVDCLLVRGPDGELEVPILERYVASVDLEAREIIVDALEDLEALRHAPGRG